MSTGVLTNLASWRPCGHITSAVSWICALCLFALWIAWWSWDSGFKLFFFWIWDKKNIGRSVCKMDCKGCFQVICLRLIVCHCSWETWLPKDLFYLRVTSSLLSLWPYFTAPVIHPPTPPPTCDHRYKMVLLHRPRLHCRQIRWSYSSAQCRWFVATVWWSVISSYHKCVLLEGILIREHLGTPLLPEGTVCMLSSVTQRKDGPGLQVPALTAF